MRRHDWHLFNPLTKHYKTILHKISHLKISHFNVFNYSTIQDVEPNDDDDEDRKKKKEAEKRERKKDAEVNKN